MSGANYEFCPGCDSKALYMGEEDVPDGVVVWHEKCLAGAKENSRLVTMNRIAWALQAAAIAQHGNDDEPRVEVYTYEATQTVTRFLEMDDASFSRELVLIAEATAHRINDTGTTNFDLREEGPTP
jgi:hypothetical protein